MKRNESAGAEEGGLATRLQVPRAAFFEKVCIFLRRRVNLSPMLPLAAELLFSLEKTRPASSKKHPFRRA